MHTPRHPGAALHARHSREQALAAPLLSLLGTAVALLMGAVVGGGGGFDMISPDEYWREMRPLLLERPVAAAPARARCERRLFTNSL